MLVAIKSQDDRQLLHGNPEFIADEHESVASQRNQRGALTPCQRPLVTVQGDIHQALRLVAQTLLVTIGTHTLFTLMLVDLCLPSLL
jgi:hypothetical protein